MTAKIETSPVPLIDRIHGLGNLLKWSALLAIVATLVKSARPLDAMAHQKWLVINFSASQWWLDYDHAGFVRRGLPGQLLAWLVGGSPSAWTVSVAALTVTGAAIVALVGAVRVMARRAEPNMKLVVAALVAASPFTFGQQVRDIGRYDAIGVCAVLGLVAVRRAPRVAPAVAAVAVLVSGLSEEYLVAFVAPVAVLVTAAGRSGWRRVVVPAAAVLPGVVATAVSCVVKPTLQGLAAAEDAAHAARPDIVPGQVTAIASLWQTPGQAFGHLEVMTWWVLPLATVLVGGCYAVSVLLLWHLLGRPARFLPYAAFFALVAVGVSLSAVDYQRWWTMAFVSAIAVLALSTEPGEGPPVTVSRRLVIVVIAMLALSIAGQTGPINAGRLDSPSGVGISLPQAP